MVQIAAVGNVWVKGPEASSKKAAAGCLCKSAGRRKSRAKLRHSSEGWSLFSTQLPATQEYSQCQKAMQETTLTHT